MGFDPFTGQFRPKVSATLDPLVYKELKDSTLEVAEEAEFIRSHVGKDKQHIREIKTKLRELEAKVEEVKNIPKETSKEVLDLTSAMEFDLLHNKMDLLTNKTESELLSILNSLSSLESELEKLKNKKTSSLVSVKIDEEISEKFLELQFRYSVLADKHLKLEESLEIQTKQTVKYFKTSVLVSIGTTLLLIALKFLV